VNHARNRIRLAGYPVASEPEIIIDTNRELVITLKLGEQYAADLWQSIYEATAQVGSWRSDPAILIKLMEAVKAVAGGGHTHYQVTGRA
jgi:hypothetical protein